MTNQTEQEWEKDFRKRIDGDNYESDGSGTLRDDGTLLLYKYNYPESVYELNPEKVVIFIQEQINLAKQAGIREERERIKELVQENHDGTFTDDGGNDCWYIDKLVEALDKEIESPQYIGKGDGTTAEFITKNFGRAIRKLGE